MESNLLLCHIIVVSASNNKWKKNGVQGREQIKKSAHKKSRRATVYNEICI